VGVITPLPNELDQKKSDYILKLKSYHPLAHKKKELEIGL
jgi:hypothetical protein